MTPIVSVIQLSRFMSQNIRIPNKHYFTIGEVSKLCSIETHVLRYWEQVFPQLEPVRRRGKRRYYSRQEIELIQRIMRLLYDEGFTIQGAKRQLNSEQDGGMDAQSLDHGEVITQTIAHLEEVVGLLTADASNH